MKLLTRILNSNASATDPTSPTLLGDGADSIILRTTRAPSDIQRLLRYARAVHVFYTRASNPSSQVQMLALRARLGEHYRAAWSAGRFPRFNSMGRPQSLRFAELRSEARAS